MSIIPLIKINNHSKSYYFEAVKKINHEFKKIKFYFEDYIEEIIRSNISNEDIQLLLKKNAATEKERK